MKEEHLYTAEEMAQVLKVSKQLLYNLSNPKLPLSQRLPSIRIGRLRRFRYDAVLQYFEDRNYENHVRW